MAIMASPTPDASADSKSRDSLPEKEQKPELNGHAPTADPKAEDELPKVNGTAKEEENHVNGVTEDVKMENSEESKAPTSPTKNEPTKVETEETKPKSEEPTTDSAPVPNDDVEMEDAAPVKDDIKPAEDKPVEDDAAKPESKPVAESSEDSEMTEKPTENIADKSDKPTEKAADEATAEKVNGLSEAPPSSDPLPGSEVDLQPASLSQLAIESESARPSIEVAMKDAPAVDSAPSAKVAREREDDGADEPAPKRARTEPKDDDAMNAEPTPSALADNSQSDKSDLSDLRKWDDTSVSSQVLTPYQRREIRKVLGRVKKTKQGMHFRDSVQKLWPVLWDSYVAKIEKPTDLSEIDRTLRDPAGLYRTVGDFKQDLLLMYENTLSFNGPAHDVTQAAKGCIRNIWEDVLTIPQEEPAKPKPAPKQKPPRESRAAAHPEPVARKPSAAPSPVAEAPPKSTPSKDQPSELRRASTTTEGDRPKRTVRPPKAKDIDYSTKPSRKKLKPELQFCEEVLNELMHPKNREINTWFMEAVDAEGLAIPHYYSIIKKPMDLGKVSRMLSSGEITSLKDFDKNVRLIFGNCYQFNGTPDQGNAVSYVAKQLEDFYNSQMKQKDTWLAKHAKANAPPQNSYGSDEEEEEEEADVASSGVDHAKEIRELEAKLREESEKLTDLYAADLPNSALINVQQGILKMVQEALLAAKSTQSEFRQKNEKSSKKSSKPSKSKSSGGAARKPSNAAHPKKSGGTKKAVKKNLTAADKDAIANAINDLEYPHLDRAIDIIKRDTGQNENNQGELELDIDQLSNEALLKLWELCKKVLPGFGKDSAPAPDSSPEISRAAPAKSAKNAAKPKKNKPMSAREQEERIAQLRGLRDLYRPGTDGPDGQGAVQAPTSAAEDSSDDSDSEEE